MLSSKIHLPIMMLMLIFHLAFKYAMDNIVTKEKRFDNVSILYDTSTTNNVLRG